MADDSGGYQTLEVRVEGPTAVVTLCRPEKYNALSAQLLVELEQALAALESREAVRSVVLSGGPRFFSAGADLDEAVTITEPRDYLEFNRRWRRLTYTIEHLMLPVVAAVDGYCLTGGLEIALACDFRIAGEGAKFGITSAKIGSVAGAGGTQRLPRLVGPAAAKRLLMTAEFIDAQEAHRIGLVEEVVPAGEAEKRALEIGEVLAARAPLSLAWHKHAVNVGAGMDLESALDLEAALSARAFATRDKAEGMRAFLEKRDPAFEGR
jgi:enoyl-CoA hydratase/carnithine racemase